jgi:glycosyltransferase involved in cell wall biosynthesis
MHALPSPTVAVVVGAYQSERWIAEALDSILGQTRPPDEVVVVDDGSTDGTAAVLERYADRIRIVRQPNGGCPAAHNRGIREARSDFVALCGADDIWEPQKLEWQLEAIRTHPEADVFFGHALLFDRVVGEHARPPGSGLLDIDAFREALYRANCVCAPSVVIRRSRFQELGPFIENFGADDYEYWFRCLRAGVRFYYDPRPLLRWRQHGENLSWKRVWMDECCHRVLRQYEGDVRDRAAVDEALAPLLLRIARQRVDAGQPREARQAFRDALLHARGSTLEGNLRALAWVVVLALPRGAREWAGRASVALSRAVRA